MKHTPGPWQVSWNTFNRGEAHGIYANGEMDLKGFQIAVVHYYPTMDNNANEETGKANAKLIATAPSLIEALQLLVDSMIEPEHQEKWYNKYKGDQRADFALVNAIKIIKEATHAN